MTEHAVKTILTRAGKNTKIILSGDLSQIDNPRLDSENNGLRIWAERSRNLDTGFPHSTYILLESNFRSDLSAWASSFYEWQVRDFPSGGLFFTLDFIPIISYNLIKL